MQTNAAAAPPSDVAIVSDSSSCLPPNLLAEHRILVVPLALLVDGELYHDGELSAEAFRDKLDSAIKAPSTTAPAPGEFLQAFRTLHQQGTRSILCLTLSAAYSGTHSAAENAAEMARREMPDLRLAVLDTGGLAMAHGFAVLAAARAAEAGANLEEAAGAARRVASRSHLVGALDTMSYLAKSGRVPWIVHWAASVLQIKPVLVAYDGRVRSFGRPRTMRNALTRLVRYLEPRAGPPEKLHVAVAHYDSPQRASELAERVRDELNPAELFVTEFTPVMSVHAGPGFVGLAFYSEAELEIAPARSPTAERDADMVEAALGQLPMSVERPAFVMLSGLPGAGKSRLAGEIEKRMPVAVVESDRLRKVLVERPTYSPMESTRTFEAIHALLERLLDRGVPCLLDATNLREEHRRPLYEIAERTSARLLVVAVEAPPELALARISGRGVADTSDANPAVFEKMREDAQPIEHDHLVVDGTGDAGVEAERVARELGTRN
jgi:DegV family protein with EDD domain